MPRSEELFNHLLISYHMSRQYSGVLGSVELLVQLYNHTHTRRLSVHSDNDCTSVMIECLLGTNTPSCLVQRLLQLSE